MVAVQRVVAGPLGERIDMNKNLIVKDALSYASRVVRKRCRIFNSPEYIRAHIAAADIIDAMIAELFKEQK